MALKKNFGASGKREYFKPPNIIVPSHPLDPLTPDEILLAVKICKQLRPGNVFASISLYEPPKAEVLQFNPGDAFDRKVFAVIHDHKKGKTYELVINISIDEADGPPGKEPESAPPKRGPPQTLEEREARVVDYEVVGNELTSLKHIPGVQPRLMPHEFDAIEKLLSNHQGFQEALKKRGITDPSKVKADTWSVGYFTPEDDPERRLTRPLFYYKRSPDSEEYNVPIEGLSPLIDLNRLEVVRLDDYRIHVLPPDPTNYKTAYMNSKIPQLLPLKYLQPDGPSFRLDGYHLMWHKWDMRLGFSPREGLILSLINFFDTDAGRLRPILYRASLSEMVVPYGNPSAPHFRKNAFDVGEDSIGENLNSLMRDCDCIGEAAFLDVHLADGDGDPVTIPNAICVHEEDAGILWKHTDFRTDKPQVRRARRLVVSTFTTVANYDYGLNWYFYQDGTIEFDAILTGILSSKVVSGSESTYGTTISENISGTNHQHFFAFRLDMMVDGLNNSVYEINSETMHPSDVNPHKNAWVARKTQIKTEGESGRVVNPLGGRYWAITNPAIHNKYGDMVAYKLEPGETVLPMCHPESPILKRAPFLTKHFWVTRREDNVVKYIAGDYPNQSKQEEGGIVSWIESDPSRSLDNTDLVVWYNFGVHHIPRPEDWPVMPAIHAGFKLKPSGFFNENPCMDVAPPPCFMEADKPVPPAKL